MAQNIEFDPSKFKIPENLTGNMGLVIILVLFGLFFLSSAYYTVDTNENGVILRFGKFTGSTPPGLHFKLPFGIDKVYKVQVGRQFKEEFGFRTRKAGKRTEYSSKSYQEESWMLTGDLNIAEVEWIVQYKIKDPFAYLFSVKDPRNTIRDVSEAVMRLMIGDRSFNEVIQSERKNINLKVMEMMQTILDSYNSGISVQLVQLQGLVPPGPVAESFNEVNRAKQDQEAMVNEARQAYNKEIFRAEGEAQRMVKEADGYAIERVNNAKGDVALFDKVLREYKKAPQITRDRLYIENMKKVLSKIDDKTIIDRKLDNLLPLLNLNQKGN